MRVIIHECEQYQSDEHRIWIQDELKLPIFKETRSSRDDDIYRFFLIVMDEEDLSALRLKYPEGTFKNL